MSESHNARIDVPELTADQIQARVLHRDGLMLVIDKPAGLPVHRGPKGGANLEASFDALRFGLPRPPVLAHRLDRDTSGCLVLGRHRKATASLGLLFKHGRISKTYWAVVEGGPVEDEGVIDMPLGRLNAERGWWQKPDPEGQTAVTRWKVLGRSFVAAPVVGDVYSPPPCGVETSEARSQGSGVGVPQGQTAVVDPPSPALPHKRGGSNTSHLARARTGDRPHPSIARSRGLHGLADCRRQYLWKWTALRRAEPASAFPRDRDSDFQEQGAGARSGAGAGAFAATAAGLRMEWGIASLAFFPSPLVGEGGFAKRRRVRGLFLPIGRNPSSGTDFA